jgi:hypothetical protein
VRRRRWTDQHLEHRRDARLEELRELPAGQLPQGRGGPIRTATIELRADRRELRPQHRQVEPFLRAVVVVAGGDVGAGALRDVADGRAVEAALREQLDRGVEQSVGRRSSRGHPHERALKTFV